jgi:hypothetical protein
MRPRLLQNKPDLHVYCHGAGSCVRCHQPNRQSWLSLPLSFNMLCAGQLLDLQALRSPRALFHLSSHACQKQRLEGHRPFQLAHVELP